MGDGGQPIPVEVHRGWYNQVVLARVEGQWIVGYIVDYVRGDTLAPAAGLYCPTQFTPEGVGHSVARNTRGIKGISSSGIIPPEGFPPSFFLWEDTDTWDEGSP